MNKDLLELLLAIRSPVRIAVKEEGGQVAYTIKMTEADITFLYQSEDFKDWIDLPEASEIADILPLDDYKFVAEIDNITLQSAIKQFNLWPEHIWRWGQVFFEFHPDHIRLHYDDGNIGKSLTIPVSVIQDDIKHVFEAYIATAFFKWFSHYNGKIIITINDIDSRTKHGIAMIIRYGTCEMVLCKMTSP